MSTWLFPIALDLLATALIAGPCHPPPLLQGVWILGGLQIWDRILSYWGALGMRVVRVVVGIVVRIG